MSEAGDEAGKSTISEDDVLINEHVYPSGMVLITILFPHFENASERQN